MRPFTLVKPSLCFSLSGLLPDLFQTLVIFALSFTVLLGLAARSEVFAYR
jgi:hypothetical protein